MKRTILLLLFAVSAVFQFSGWAQDLSLYEKRTYTYCDTFTLPYRIAYPQDFSSTKKYPLVLFLHGAGERGDDNQAQLTHGAELFIDPVVRKKHPAIVLFPQCPKNSSWFRHSELMRVIGQKDESAPIELLAVKGVIDQLIASGIVDERRIYITGLSMGGFGTFGMVSMYPSFFAAAAPICGGANLVDIPRYARELPFFIFHGAEDNVVKPEYSRDAARALYTAGCKVLYKEYPKVGHNSWDNAFADPNYIKWIFKQKRKK